MSISQGLAFGLMGLAVILFVWGRIRYDVVALLVLALSIACKVVPAKEAFSGFSSDIVIIIGSALVVSAAVSRSGVVQAALRPVLSKLKSTQSQVAVLVPVVTLLSMVTKNVGALAIMMPVALQQSRRTGKNPAAVLMPMAFGSMLGGMVTLVGTAPNIIVSQVRSDVLGKPFGMFAYAPVGLMLAAIGIVFLTFGYRLLPRDRRAAVGLNDAIDIKDYLTEARVPLDWVRSGETLSDLHAMAGPSVRITALVRVDGRAIAPLPDAAVQREDTLVMRGDQGELEEFVARAGLRLARSETHIEASEAEPVRSAEAVVGEASPLVGRSASEIDLFDIYAVNLLAIGRSGQRLSSRLSNTPLKPGDMVVLQGSEAGLPAALRGLGLLPLAERDISLGSMRRSLLPLVVLALAMGLVALKIVPVAVAFFGAAVLLMAVGSIGLRDAYHAIDGPVLVLVAALIPVSDAVRATGGADLVAGWLSSTMQSAPPLLAVGLTMAAAMAVTPFLNNAATVLLLGPIAVGVAQRLGLNPDPFLMAVAVGSACDFLTPIGHQCNTLVMGPGGYRFTDYWRLGLPLTVAVLLAGPPMIALVWGLRAAG